jgi:hypothetical protein
MQHPLYLALAARLDPRQESTVGQQWASFNTSQTTLAYEQVTKSVTDNPPPLRTDRIGLKRLHDLAIPVYHAQQVLAALLVTAVHQGLVAARQNQQETTSHARTTTLTALSTVILTAAMLFAIGGIIRQRLRRLADSPR